MISRVAGARLLVAELVFTAGHLSAVYGLRLKDGREVVLKLRGGGRPLADRSSVEDEAPRNLPQQVAGCAREPHGASGAPRSLTARLTARSGCCHSPRM